MLYAGARRGGGRRPCPELMNYQGQHFAVQRCAMQYSLGYMRAALEVWLAAAEKFNYLPQDNAILTAIGFTR